MPALTGAVLIVAPPTLLRHGLLLTLQQAWPALDFILTADAGQAPGLLRRQPYRLVVVDGLLPDPPLSRLLELLHLARANQQLLLLTSQRISTSLRQALEAVRGLALLPRHAAPEAVLLTIEPLLGGESEGGMPAAAAARVPRAVGPPTPFSRRELEVLRLVVNDCCNQEIADQLFLSVRTVESHRRTLLQKAGAKTLVGLVVQAVRQGWVGV
ncbi:two component transcriptional regulator, LuxR family [Hymenobacter daecheongensis DSM 21074]|uniref:Two component transcriptional regulator, LuxR family n=1 Tax=Hymenobacter daecheongensis DSM 21074 TaxID=1121955 RepID=A0A1M6IS72_9BACT|nr:LuxR C-terminal-related transcriptional regulator [Hymenobacter daecheongensis]SHJ37326.1 two component transcriptional regulator, LuxR family [Hymenobacter daecheongensis DSM 21074]